MPVDTQKKRKNFYGQRMAIAGRRIQSLDAKLWFGKYDGRTIRQVMGYDIEYLHWLANADEFPYDSKPLRDQPIMTPLAKWRIATLKNFLKRILKPQNGRTAYLSPSAKVERHSDK